MKPMAILWMTANLMLLAGCSFAPNIGPTTLRKTVYVDRTDSQGRPVKIGRIAENQKLKVEIVTESGDVLDDKLDVGGWQVSPPAKSAQAMTEEHYGK